MQVHPRNILGKEDKQLLHENLSHLQPLPLKSHIHIQHSRSILHIPPSAPASAGQGEGLPDGGQRVSGAMMGFWRDCPSPPPLLLLANALLAQKCLCPVMVFCKSLAKSEEKVNLHITTPNRHGAEGCGLQERFPPIRQPLIPSLAPLLQAPTWASYETDHQALWTGSTN